MFRALIALCLFLVVLPAQMITIKRGPLLAGGGGGSAPTFASNTCHGNNFGGTTQTCTFTSNLHGSGGYIVGIMTVTSTGALTASGCSITFTHETAVPNGTAVNTRVFWGAVGSTSACTLTATSTVTGSMTIDAAEYSGTTGVDVHAPGSSNFVTAGNPISCPAVTTTVNNDRVLCLVVDSGEAGGTYTAGAGFVVDHQTVDYGQAIESGVKAVAGSITPDMTYTATTNIISSATVALKP